MDAKWRSRENEYNLSVLEGLRVDRIVLSRYQVDIHLQEDSGAGTGIITLETEIFVAENATSFSYNIEMAQGCMPASLVNDYIAKISYERARSLSVQFKGGASLIAGSAGTGNEFGAIRVSKDDVGFLLPLI